MCGEACARCDLPQLVPHGWVGSAVPSIAWLPSGYEGDSGSHLHGSV